MQKKIIILGLGAIAVWLAFRKARATDSYLFDITDTVNNGINTTLSTISEVAGMGGFFRVRNAKLAKVEMLNINNVKAMLAVIRKGEGTSDANGYRRIFGGQLFTSYADHPRILVKKSGLASTAAGAYQFLASTWDETARIMGLGDFSPANQDLGALGRIAARGALDDVINGRFETAIKKMAKEWASLPFSPYGQPVQTLAAARLVYLANSGAISA